MLKASQNFKIIITALFIFIFLFLSTSNTVSAFSVKYRTLIPGSSVNSDNWMPWILSPLTSGTVNETGLRKDHIRVYGYIAKLNVMFSDDNRDPLPPNARIEFRVFRDDTKNWESSVVTTSSPGCVGHGAFKFFAIQMALLNAPGYGIKYHIEWPGPCAWTEVRSDGQLAGNRGFGRAIRNIEIWIYKKDDSNSEISQIDFNRSDLLKDQQCENEPGRNGGVSRKKSCDGTPHNSFKCRLSDWQNDPGGRWTWHKCYDGHWIYGNAGCTPGLTINEW